MSAPTETGLTVRTGPEPRSWGRVDWLVFSLVLIIAAFLRFYRLGSQPLWLDEGYSWWDARQTLHSLWNLVPQCDPHPPLYFVLLKGWLDVFGDGETAMRALSALTGVATTALIMLTGREIDRRIGWLAGLFFALTPFQIEFGHEARPYTLLCFGAALLLFGAIRLARVAAIVGQAGRTEATDRLGLLAVRNAVRVADGQALTGWASLLAGGVIVMWTNNTSILMVGAACLAFLILVIVDPGMRKLLKPTLLAMVLVFLIWLPYLPVMIEQARGVESDFWIPKPEGWRLTNELRFVVSMNQYDAVWWMVAVIAAGLLLLARRGRWREALVLAALAAVPVVLNYAISMTIKPVFIARALIGIAPAVAVIAAAAVMLLRARWLRYPAMAMLVVAHGLALYAWFANYLGKEPWDRIASQVAQAAQVAHASNGDRNANPIVLVAANELALPLSHALEDMNVTVPMQGAPFNFPAPGLAARYPSGKCAPSVAGQDLSSIARAVKGHRVVYFITRRNNVYDPGNGIVNYLRSLGLIQTNLTTYNPGWLEVHRFVLAGAHSVRAATSRTGGTARAH